MSYDVIGRNYAYLNESALRPENEFVSFQVLYWGFDPMHMDNPVHKHSFFEICYVLDGEGTYIDQERAFPLRKHTLFLSRPGIRHQILSSTGMFLLYVGFEVDESRSHETMSRCYRQLETTDRFVLHGMDHHPAALLWLALLEHFKNPDRSTRPFAGTAALSLLLSFYSAFRPSDSSSDEFLSGHMIATQTISRAVRFIKDNLSSSMTLASVAEYLHISSRHLSRLFQQELGMSYMDFVQQERMRRAVQLLLYSSLSVSEIAEKTGFASVHYFTRSFSRLKGVPPGKYRKYAGRDLR